MTLDYVAQMATDMESDPTLDPAWAQQLRDVATITKIIVHHEAQDEGLVYDDQPRYAAEAAYQNHSSIPGSVGLQYHFKIDNVGQINQVRPLNMILWHAGNLDVNNHSIAVCLDGNFEDQVPTREQYEALSQLLTWLSTQHPEFPAVQSDVYCHREVIDTSYFPGGTACCGTNLVPFVTSYRANNGNVPIPDVPYQHPELQPQPPVTPPPAPEPIPVPVPTPIPEPPVVVTPPVDGITSPGTLPPIVVPAPPVNIAPVDQLLHWLFNFLFGWLKKGNK